MRESDRTHIGQMLQPAGLGQGLTEGGAAGVRGVGLAVVTGPHGDPPRLARGRQVALRGLTHAQEGGAQGPVALPHRVDVLDASEVNRHL
jgi:hypothetical protein